MSVKVEALELCRVLRDGNRFYTEAELRTTALSGGTQDRGGFEEALACAKERNWIRPAHVQSHLTLTSKGIPALLQKRSSDE